mmetsp:Transcript_31551/g.53799  ORF Transcript_31551/g.53799 Transcript_31551/m.53799 type:complete len:220 (+) Transcript_31551:428-1087(+)
MEISTINWDGTYSISRQNILAGIKQCMAGISMVRNLSRVCSTIISMHSQRVGEYQITKPSSSLSLATKCYEHLVSFTFMAHINPGRNKSQKCHRIWNRLKLGGTSSMAHFNLKHQPLLLSTHPLALFLTEITHQVPMFQHLHLLLNQARRDTEILELCIRKSLLHFQLTPLHHRILQLLLLRPASQNGVNAIIIMANNVAGIASCGFACSNKESFLNGQ